MDLTDANTNRPAASPAPPTRPAARACAILAIAAASLAGACTYEALYLALAGAPLSTATLKDLAPRLLCAVFRPSCP